ncbi:MAG: dockerin type I repeat-containing protein, partial [Oscillospiraceae bacterium]|nr:dockerin type I repeat-containing protein [Oscillospiraceae bacterium]
FTENTKVYAHWRLPGDVNGDGNVDGTDVTLLATYVKAGGLNVRIVPYSGDVSGDENVDGTDVTLLATFVKANGLNVVIH